METVSQRPITVVIAEDHALVREGTRQILEAHADLEVVGEAADGNQAVATAVEKSPDIVLMDIAMPGVNGIEATRLIKEKCPSTSVLVLTAYDDDQYVFALLDAGAAGYLLKSVRGDELVQAVRSVFEGESVLHPEIAPKVFRRFTAASRGGSDQAQQPLTEREVEVLTMAATGLSNKMIAGELTLSDRTVQVHLSNIFSKLGVASRTEAVIIAMKRGLLRLEDIS